MMQSPPTQKGVAIITALLIVALGTIAVVAIASRQQLDLHREQNEALIQDARSFSNAGERFAAALLFMDHDAQQRNESDSLDDDWAQTIPPITIDQMSLQGCIVDMQGRFNLNNVVNVEGIIVPDQVQILKRLLQKLSIDVTKADAIVDWLDADVDPTIPDGAEDDYYNSLAPAYQATNAPFTSVSELQLVKGFSPSVEEEKEAYELLLPHIAALPVVDSPIAVNVNTATPEVIASLADELSGSEDLLSRWETGKYEDYPECEDIFDLAAEEQTVLGEAKDTAPYETEDEFFELAGLEEAELGSMSNYTVRSYFYQVRVDVVGESAKLTQYSLLERDTEGRSRVIFRSRDTL